MRQRDRFSRRGIAAVEMAFVAPVLLIFVVGLWEVGRYVMIQNILDSAARDTGRLAASGAYFSSSNHTNALPPNGTLTLHTPSTNVDYEVQKIVQVYLKGAGINTNGLTVTVGNQGTTATPRTWSYTYAPNGTSTGSGYDPTANATQLDQLTLTVNLPYANVAWSPVSWIISSSTTMSASTTWLSLNDIPLTVSSTIPTKPLQAGDALP